MCDHSASGTDVYEPHDMNLILHRSQDVSPRNWISPAFATQGMKHKPLEPELRLHGALVLSDTDGFTILSPAPHMGPTQPPIQSVPGSKAAGA
jgi:hypothetical protein